MWIKWLLLTVNKNNVNNVLRAIFKNDSLFLFFKTKAPKCLRM